MLLIKGNTLSFQIRSMDFDFLQTSHLFSVLSLKQSSRLRFRIATRGACRKRCSSKFCKIHMKAPVSELFLNKRETPTKMLSWEFCEISKTPFDQTSTNLQLFWKKDSAGDVFLWILWNVQNSYSIEHLWNSTTFSYIRISTFRVHEIKWNNLDAHQVSK